jgi:hypothetical protein
MAPGRFTATLFWILISGGLGGCAFFISPLEKEVPVPSMTKEELKSLLGNPEVIILDMRKNADWKPTRWKIQGAVREDPENGVEPWFKKYPQDKTFVLYRA